jgi:hypothetical protein
MKKFVFILIASCSLFISCNDSNDGGIPSSIEGVWRDAEVDGQSSWARGVFFHDDEFGSWGADLFSGSCRSITSGKLIEKDGNKYTFEWTDQEFRDDNTEFSIFLFVDGNELTIRQGSYDSPNGLFFKEADNINQSETGCF